MAKKVKITYESDVVEGIEFDNENKMLEFDKKIKDDAYVIECSKKYIEEFAENIDIDREFRDGFIFIKWNKNFCDFVCKGIKSDYLINTPFYELVENVTNYDCDLLDDYSICTVLEETIKKNREKINNLVKFKNA